jgi:hypothetical protein
VSASKLPGANRRGFRDGIASAVSPNFRDRQWRDGLILCRVQILDAGMRTMCQRHGRPSSASITMQSRAPRRRKLRDGALRFWPWPNRCSTARPLLRHQNPHPSRAAGSFLGQNAPIHDVLNKALSSQFRTFISCTGHGFNERTNQSALHPIEGPSFCVMENGDRPWRYVFLVRDAVSTTSSAAPT